VYNITGGRDLTLAEVNRVSEVVTAVADPNCNIIFGAGALRQRSRVAPRGVLACWSAIIAGWLSAIIAGWLSAGRSYAWRAARRASGPPRPRLALRAGLYLHPQSSSRAPSHFLALLRPLTLSSVVDEQYDGELHVTIIATGFAPTYENELLNGGSASQQQVRPSLVRASHKQNQEVWRAVCVWTG
jgi:hypothetical protein